MSPRIKWINFISGTENPANIFYIHWHLASIIPFGLAYNVVNSLSNKVNRDRIISYFLCVLL